MNLLTAKMPNQLVDKNNFKQTETINGVTYTNNGDGSCTINGTAMSNSKKNLIDFSTPCIVNHKYFVSNSASDTSQVGLNRLIIPWYGVAQGTSFRADGMVVSEIITATATDRCYCYAYVYSGITVSDLVIRPQVIDLTELYGAGNEPTTVAQFRADYPLDYYPYSANSYTGLLKQNGKLVSADISQMLPQGIGCVDLGTLSWSYTNYNTTYYFQVKFTKGILLLNNYQAGFMCEKYLPWSSISSNSSIQSVPDKTATIYTGDGSGDYIRIKDSDYTDATTFKTAMSGVLLFYKKATT